MGSAAGVRTSIDGMAAMRRISVAALAIGLVLAGPVPAGAQADWTLVPSPNSPGATSCWGLPPPMPATCGRWGGVVDFTVRPAT